VTELTEPATKEVSTTARLHSNSNLRQLLEQPKQLRARASTSQDDFPPTIHADDVKEPLGEIQTNGCDILHIPILLNDKPAPVGAGILRYQGGRTIPLLLGPARRRACTDHARSVLAVSERRACAALGQHRSTQRKVPRGRDDEERLTADIVELARQYGRYGYRKIAALLITAL
jgi:hypothetical protein